VKENLPSDGPSAFVLIQRLHWQPRPSNPENHPMSDYDQLTCDTTREAREPALVWWMHRTEGWSQPVVACR
jgi:hypothetical protein